MNCEEVREKLSDYIDGLVTAQDDALIRTHIAGCQECRTALSELRKTVGHIRNLQEVEPPEWLTQRVMTRVREEAGTGKGLWRKLFHPLHIKLPLEAAAAVVIAVTSLYIFNMTQGGLKITSSLHVREQYVPKEDKAQTKSAAAAENKSTRGSKNILNKEPPAPAHSQQPKRKDAAAPAHEEITESSARQEISAAPKAVLPGPPGPLMHSEGSSAPESASGNAGHVMSDDRKEEEAMARAVPPAKEAEKQGRMEGYPMQASGGHSASGRISGEAVSIALEVDNPDKAGDEVRKVLKNLDGRKTSTETFPDKTVFTSELDSQKIAELFNELKIVGRIKHKAPPAGLGSGTVVIRIEILKSSSK